MIVQACLNGARPMGYHARLPLLLDQMVADARDCLRAGAAELHVHPRDDAARESLSAVDKTMTALRAACPGTLIGVSTGAWIEGDVGRTRDCIAGWRNLPDYASVNLSEPDAPAIMALLADQGVGIEAGLATLSDADRLLDLPGCDRVFRILIEIEEQDLAEAHRIMQAIAARLETAGLRRPILLHGFDATVWDFVAAARDRMWSTRIGLEDGRLRPDGTVCTSNADLVAQAVAIMRAAPPA